MRPASRHRPDVVGLVLRVMREGRQGLKTPATPRSLRGMALRGSRKVGDFPVYYLNEPRVDIMAALGLAGALEDEDLAQRFSRGT